VLPHLDVHSAKKKSAGISGNDDFAIAFREEEAMC
jgi:hypothetical protein